MAYNPNLNPGQATMANSAPVVIASDQSRIPVGTLPSAITATTGNITASGQSVSANVTTAGVATISISGTYAGVAGVIEVSDDNTIWYLAQAQRVDNGVIENTITTLPANTARMWDIATTGFTFVRFRATAWTSGTVNIRITPGANAFEPTPTAQIVPVNNLVTGLTAGALNADLIPATNVEGYLMAYLDLATAFVGTLTYQGSNDGVTQWDTVTAWNITSVAYSTTNGGAVNRVAIPLNFRFLRVRMTAYTSGTATGSVSYSTKPYQAHAMQAIQSGTWTISNLTGAAALSDSIANPSTAMVGASLMQFNGTTYERVRSGNVASAIVATATAITVTTNSTDQTAWNHKALQLFYNVTAVSGTSPTNSVKVQIKDGTSLNYVDVPGAVFSANTAGMYTLTISPSTLPATSGNNTFVQGLISRTFRIVETLGGTTPSFTRQIAYVNL